MLSGAAKLTSDRGGILLCECGAQQARMSLIIEIQGWLIREDEAEGVRA